MENFNKVIVRYLTQLQAHWRSLNATKTLSTEYIICGRHGVVVELTVCKQTNKEYEMFEYKRIKLAKNGNGWDIAGQKQILKEEVTEIANALIDKFC